MMKFYSFSSKRALMASRKKSWNEGMTGIPPIKPGYYWIFIRSWRLTKVDESEQGFLKTSFPKGKRVDRINPDRWGAEFK